jgi:aspartate/methionine/tyrosine aminotransferase
MDFAVAEPIRRVLQRALDTSDLGYPIHPGPTDLPEVFAARARERFGWQVAPRRVEILTDVVQGMYVGIDRLSAPGDGVVVQTPIYAPFLRAVEETGRRLCESPLVPGPAGYELDPGGLRRAAAGARLLLLCHPHNPTGRAFRRAELEAVAEVALANDLSVLSDEIHADLVLSGEPFVPFASLAPEVAARTITLSSASRPSTSGLRTAVAVFGATISAAASSSSRAICAAASTRSASTPRAPRGATAGPGSTRRSTTCAGTAISSGASCAAGSPASCTTRRRPPTSPGSTAAPSSSARRPGASSSTAPASRSPTGPPSGRRARASCASTSRPPGPS